MKGCKARRVVGVFFLLVLLPLACQPSRGAKDRRPFPDARDELEACLRQEAVADLKEDGKRRCVGLLERFVDEQAGDPRLEWASFQLGRFYMERMDFSAAGDLFSAFPERFPSSTHHRLARIHLGICLYYLDRYQESLEMLHPLAEDPLAKPQAAEISRYLAENYTALRNLPSALLWYQRCLDLLKRDTERTGLQKRILEVMSRGWDPEALQQAANLFADGFFAEAVRFGLASTLYLNRQPRLALHHLQRLADRHEKDVFTPYVSTLRKRISSESLPRICAIGCLLPLTGRYEKFGDQVLEALLLGSGAFQPFREAGLSIRLSIRDTRGDPRVAVSLLRELASDPEVVGIVGPLLVSEAQACAPEAQKLSVPLMTLSQREEVARGADYVFANGLSMHQQTETLVGYAVQGLGCARFAVLYPDNSYGRLARDLFAGKVLEAGGRLVSSVSYAVDKADFQEEVRRLARESGWSGTLPTPAPDAAAPFSEHPGTGAEQRELPPGMAAELAQQRAGLPFDALFIPDDYRKVSLIAPYLAFHDLRGVVLLGTNAWNSPHLVESAGEYLRDAVFVDGFFAESGTPPVPDLVAEFRMTLQREPGLLEALAYDSLSLFAEAFERAQPKTRSGVRDALARTEGYPGLSGPTRFDAEGRARKPLYLLAIQDNRIRQIQ